ncbi:MAG: cyclic pyranopterin monophosphate synthase MoaC [Clostridiales bacterium]
MSQQLNHFDQAGQAHMVDAGAKPITTREAVAEGWIRMKPETLRQIRSGSAKKGDVTGVARLAGIMAVKKTPELIPLCHTIHIEGCSVDFAFEESTSMVQAVCRVLAADKTGAEMEALTGVTIALLTIYDMVKAIDRGMEITGVCLRRKSGGKSGLYQKGAEENAGQL